MMTFTDALAIMKKDEEEERNWRSARSKLTELLTTCLNAHDEWVGKSAQVEALDRTIQMKQAELTRVEARVHEKTEMELRQRRKEMASELKGVTDQIADTQARFAPLRAELAELNAELRQKQTLLANLKA